MRAPVLVVEWDEIMSFVKRILRQPRVPEGRFTYRGEGKFAGLALQLRIEHGGKGVMVINANTVLYLNETATSYAYFFMQGLPEDEVLKNIRSLYRVNQNTAKEDYERLIYTISTLAQTEEVCPISFLDVERLDPFTQKFSAPIRMDLTLSFRCQNNCIHCYAGGPRETSEFNAEDWKKVIDKLGRIGVFILTFTGGEPTLRKDLPDLLQYAQKKGMVTGLITNGRRLKDPEYVEVLEKTGLDFVQITLESHMPSVHDLITATEGSWEETVSGIRNVVPTQIYVTTNTTLNKHNAETFLETIEFLKEMGVAAFGSNSLIYSGKGKKDEITKKFALPLERLTELLPKIKERSDQLGLKFLWYTPTQYCQLDPVKLGLGVKSCSAAKINMCIGPTGDVYPCQSYFKSLGNILKDDWRKIWGHPVATQLRNRGYLEQKCKDCPQLQICGGGCPLELEKENYICAQTQ